MDNTIDTNPKASQEAAEVYSHFLLTIYDSFVLSFVCPLIWRCPKSKILSIYNRHASDFHLDIGVGTGYFLDRCKFPTISPEITLLDLSKNCLDRTANRIQRYQPALCMADILEPLELGSKKFDSVALNYVLHCLPGSIEDKAKVFENIKPFLNPSAVVFGATVLGKNLELTFIPRKLMSFYNKKRIFNNLNDDADSLKSMLEQYFDNVTIEQVGCVAIFSATNQ
jgi:ubiquinone/menaquinone biosynthesis C-methylase UbiE